MKPRLHAQALVKTNGLMKALKIADAAKKATKPSDWHALPRSDLFYKANRQGNDALAERELLRLHNYWTEVYSLLNKLS